jgi:hypothetical protein
MKSRIAALKRNPRPHTVRKNAPSPGLHLHPRPITLCKENVAGISPDGRRTAFFSVVKPSRCPRILASNSSFDPAVPSPCSRHSATISVFNQYQLENSSALNFRLGRGRSCATFIPVGKHLPSLLHSFHLPPLRPKPLPPPHHHIARIAPRPEEQPKAIPQRQQPKVAQHLPIPQNPYAHR